MYRKLDNFVSNGYDEGFIDVAATVPVKLWRHLLMRIDGIGLKASPSMPLIGWQDSWIEYKMQVYHRRTVHQRPASL